MFFAISKSTIRLRETTGINASFDQILQFAAIRTDADLNEIERFEVRSRILPGTLASPHALRVTGVRAAQLVDPQIPSHYEMMRQVQDTLLSWSPALFLGYNSIEFDEHLLRHSLYKTLHLPYLTNTNGNSRSDVMRMVQATHLFRPDAITIPRSANGKFSFKLDQVAPANGFDHTNAHDALADVEATIFLCRLIAEEAPEVWSSFMRFGRKASVADHLETESIFCFSDFYFGKPFSCLATGLGPSPASDARYYIFDLAVNPDELMCMDDEELIKRLAASPKPVRSVRCNASPMLMPAEDAPAFVGTAALGDDELQRRMKTLRDNAQFCDRLIEFTERSKKDDAPSPHVEEQLYAGFFPPDDQELLTQFHGVPWERRPAIVARMVDPRLRQLGLQLIHAERPDVLDERDRLHLDQLAARRLVSDGEKLPWLTANKAEEAFESLITNAADNEKAFLLEHLALARARIYRAKQILSNTC